MNLLAGMILIGVEFDEVTAFAVLDRLMNGPKDWQRVYGVDLATLFPLTDAVTNWLSKAHPKFSA